MKTKTPSTLEFTSCSTCDIHSSGKDVYCATERNRLQIYEELTGILLSKHGSSVKRKLLPISKSK